MLRQLLLAASRSERAEAIAKNTGAVRTAVRRFVAGETADDAVEVARALTARGLQVSIDHLGEDVVAEDQAEAAVRAYLTLLDRLYGAGLAAGADVSLKLSALGLRLSDRLAAENAARVCAAAARVHATVTVDMEEHTLVERTLSLVDELRKEHPTVGVVVQAYLRDAEERCRALAVPGSRVRLCKGAYEAPEAYAHTSPREVDLSFVRCLKILMTGQGYPMIATHDRRLIEIASALAVLNEREPGSFEYQMLYGVRPAEQRRLADLGAVVRVYVPYGDDWYAYLARRLAERPANLAFAARALLSPS
ncbi:proline dehydrogenase family protein [Thermostaphylospora chromogena]|uniref:proline dehydrogenase n=1 Tax=Thermostaphylospora chromogena TaxID=35622 RepID=A0A1H1DFG8_9ACTN|nr:proline dehydrogenase family protein [Thermostaphylospora chromogena]SDQ75192.1 L-proline dehydrogenase [Thermostaphylospora chromogena]